MQIADSRSGAPQSGEGRKRTIAEWAELLGPDVFFVPCFRGTKKPMVGFVERSLEGCARLIFGAGGGSGGHPGEGVEDGLPRLR